MEGIQKRRTLQALFRELVIPLADSYLATRRCLRWDDGAKTLRAGDGAYPLSGLKSVFLVGAGKAGVPMSRAVVETLQQSPLLWERFAGGAVNVYGEQAKEVLPKVRLFAADHPNPNQESIEGARYALGILREAAAGDLVIAVISGGGSSLLTLPAAAIGLENFRLTNELLVTGGASIQEVNTVRKHLSRVKGGRLRMAAPQASFLTLVLSDVIGDDLSSIASGPTVPDPSTFEDAIQVLRRHGLWGKVPAQVRNHLERGVEGKEEETLKEEQWEKGLAARSFNLLVASNGVLLKALQSELGKPAYSELGKVEVDATPATGKVEDVVDRHFREAERLHEKARSDGTARVLLCGGEPIVRVPEHAMGRGGRSQHYALLAARRIAGHPWAVLSAGTDGIDGTSPAAGAVVDGDTIRVAREKGQSAERSLANFDSYGFFQGLEERSGEEFLILTGATGTNVNDIMLWWVGR